MVKLLDQLIAEAFVPEKNQGSLGSQASDNNRETDPEPSVADRWETILE
ncbi:hypothetical protein [Paenibacillus xylanilyticus]